MFRGPHVYQDVWTVCKCGAAATLCVYVCVYVRERLLTLLTGMSERDC